jgi:biopolymer transport protein ExbD
MPASNAQRGEPITAINVTPLVDVVLVLLIILMVTAGYIVKQAIPVDLPKGTTGEPLQLTLAITIKSDGTLFLDAEQISEPLLREKIRQARTRDPEVRAVIAADGATRHKSVVGVIDVLRREGVSKFAINVQPEDVRER